MKKIMVSDRLYKQLEWLMNNTQHLTIGATLSEEFKDKLPEWVK